RRLGIHYGFLRLDRKLIQIHRFLGSSFNMETPIYKSKSQDHKRTKGYPMKSVLAGLVWTFFTASAQPVDLTDPDPRPLTAGALVKCQTTVRASGFGPIGRCSN